MKKAPNDETDMARDAPRLTDSVANGLSDLFKARRELVAFATAGHDPLWRADGHPGGGTQIVELKGG